MRPPRPPRELRTLQPSIETAGADQVRQAFLGVDLPHKSTLAVVLSDNTMRACPAMCEDFAEMLADVRFATDAADRCVDPATCGSVFEADGFASRTVTCMCCGLTGVLDPSIDLGVDEVTL